MTIATTLAATPLDLLPLIDPEQAGGKAFNCARLKQAGFPVPDGLVVSASAAASELKELAGHPWFDQLAADTLFAVRSSGIGEDSEGQSFAVDDTPETTDDDLADALLDLVRNEPGGSWRTNAPRVKGKTNRKREIRDQLMEDGRLVNAGGGTGMKLYLPEQVDVPEQTTLSVEDGDSEDE